MWVRILEGDGMSEFGRGKNWHQIISGCPSLVQRELIACWIESVCMRCFGQIIDLVLSVMERFFLYCLFYHQGFIKSA